MKKIYAWIYILLLLIYVLLAFTLPTDPQILERYNMSQFQIRLLNLTIVGPLVLIYLAALYGFAHFRNYAASIRQSKEGPALSLISKGLMVLGFSLPVNSIVGSLTSYTRFQHPDLLSEITVFRSYLALILAGTGMYLIAKGANSLHGTINKPFKVHPYLAFLGAITLSSLYTWLITSQGQESGPHQAYYTPNWITVFTIAIPYIFIWCIGVRAALQLSRYKDSVRGVLYKRAFSHLSKGLVAIVIISILIQIVTTLSEHLNRLSLTPLLIVVYILIFMYALGFGLVARGAKKLKQIEEA